MGGERSVRNVRRGRLHQERGSRQQGPAQNRAPRSGGGIPVRAASAGFGRRCSTSFSRPGLITRGRPASATYSTPSNATSKHRKPRAPATGQRILPQAYGLSLLALPPAPALTSCCREGLSPDGTLKGMKIRANAAFEGDGTHARRRARQHGARGRLFGDAEGRCGRGHVPGLRLGRLQALRGRQGHDAADVRAGQRASS